MLCDTQICHWMVATILNHINSNKLSKKQETVKMYVTAAWFVLINKDMVTKPFHVFSNSAQLSIVRALNNLHVVIS